MTTEHEDEIADGMSDLLAQRGESFVYIRGNQTTTVTLVKQQQPAELIDNGQGILIEVQPMDFKGLTTSLPYDPPERGDKIKGGGMTFEVHQPTNSEKVFRRITQTVTRIHTKRIGG